MTPLRRGACRAKTAALVQRLYDEIVNGEPHRERRHRRDARPTDEGVDRGAPDSARLPYLGFATLEPGDVQSHPARLRQSPNGLARFARRRTEVAPLPTSRSLAMTRA